MNSKQRRRLRREFPYQAHINYYKFSESGIVNLHKLEDIHRWCEQTFNKCDYLLAQSYGHIYLSFKYECDKVLLLLTWA